MIKLLAVDMDGTCLNSKGRMSDKTLAALKQAAEKGITVVPTTGRNINCLPSKIKDERFYRYVISSNGSLVVDLKEDRKIFESLIDNKTAGEIMKKFQRHIVFKAAHIDRDYYVQGRILRHFVKKFFGDDAPAIRCVSNLAKTVAQQGRSVEEFQLFYYGEKHRDIVKKVIAPYPDICVAHSKGYAEIYNKNGSKGTALLALAKELGIKAEEIACIGDEENDISMFEVAGMPLAMGNAIDGIKQRAKYVLPSNDDDGVAEAVYRYILDCNI